MDVPRYLGYFFIAETCLYGRIVMAMERLWIVEDKDATPGKNIREVNSGLCIKPAAMNLSRIQINRKRNIISQTYARSQQRRFEDRGLLPSCKNELLGVNTDKSSPS